MELKPIQRQTREIQELLFSHKILLPNKQGKYTQQNDRLLNSNHHHHINDNDRAKKKSMHHSKIFMVQGPDLMAYTAEETCVYKGLIQEILPPEVYLFAPSNQIVCITDYIFSNIVYIHVPLGNNLDLVDSNTVGSIMASPSVSTVTLTKHPTLQQYSLRITIKL
jgi:hypothetical protein